MRVIAIILLSIICIFQQCHLNKRQQQFDELYLLADRAANDAVKYQQLYIKANTRLMQWDSMAPFLINLSGVKVK